jgi:site-specific DNA-cytosine methylase
MCSHTGATNNQWAGAFGRPSGGAGVGTRVVTMALSTKQGAILHYRQADRIFSVREVARMHGFPDSFRFGVDEALSGGAGGGGSGGSDGNTGGNGLGDGVGDACAAAAAGADAEAEEGAGAGAGAPTGIRSRASAAQSAARRAPAAAAVVSVGTDVAAAAAATQGSAAAVARAITVAYRGIGNAVPPPFGRDVARSILSARGQ